LEQWFLYLDGSDFCLIRYCRALRATNFDAKQAPLRETSYDNFVCGIASFFNHHN